MIRVMVMELGRFKVNPLESIHDFKGHRFDHNPKIAEVISCRHSANRSDYHNYKRVCQTLARVKGVERMVPVDDWIEVGALADCQSPVMPTILKEGDIHPITHLL
ncbi:MAG: hypothetical protein ACLP07_10440 [Terracidiphilus sp.]